jgi:hypothetical protein
MRSIPVLPLLAAIACLSAGGSAFGQTSASLVDPLAKGTTVGGLVHLADARDYRHCHNIHTRVYCHRRDRLPMNWPPLSDTPSQDRQKPQGVPSRPARTLDQS